MSGNAERISTGAAARILGVSNKTLLRLARAGDVPGAVQFHERLWRFDEYLLRNWVKTREAECQKNAGAEKISINVAASGTPEFKSVGSSLDAAYERLFSRKRRSGAKRS